jgi:hypothetical protein
MLTTSPAPTFLYVETDVPEGQTLDQWRRTTRRSRRRRSASDVLRHLALHHAASMRPRPVG